MFIPVMELSEKAADKLLDQTDVSGLIQTQSSNGKCSNEEVPDMLTSRQNLANFLTFARAYDGHSSFNFKYTINIEFHNVSKEGGRGRGGGGGGR